MDLKMDDIREIMKCITERIESNEDYLIELDSALGDGDLGLTMVKGFRAALEELNAAQEDDIGKTIVKSGMAMANSAAATMGTLTATGIMSAGKVVKGQRKINFADIVAMGQAAVDGIKERGKAETGDKTVLDSLVPGMNKLEECYNKDMNPVESFQEAAEAAEKGFLATRDMVSKFGRARYYGEKTRGKPDPGAAVSKIVFRALSNYFQQKFKEE